MSSFRGLFDVRPEERRTALAAFATLLAITTGHTLLETARDAIFLARLPASRLPWMYLVIVGVALALTPNLDGRRPARRTTSKVGVALALGVAAIVTSGFWFVIGPGKPPAWGLYGLYVWTGLFASWVTVQFWTLLGRAHTISQAKRVYGLIGAGSVLGGVVGALLARLTFALVPPRHALLVTAALFLFAIVPCLAVVVPREEPSPATAGTNEARVSVGASRGGSMSAGMSLVWAHPFARRVLTIVFLATVTLTLGDFFFKARIAHHVHDATALGEYLSTFYAVTNGLALAAQLVVAPWLFRTFGVQRALFAFPVLLLLSAGTVLATGGAVFSALLLKGVDGTLRYSIHRTSMELLLVPVPDGTRERMKPLIDLLGTRGGQAAGSLAILGLVALGFASPFVLGAVLLLLTLVWLGSVMAVRQPYLDVFRETLRSGGLSGKAELPPLDLGALEALFAGLNSTRDGEVLASLDLLAEQHRERLIPALILYHPSREVVLRALEIFAAQGRVDFVPIADRLNDHPDREIAAAALRARTAVAPDKEVLLERLDDECSQVKATALVALIARGWLEPEEAWRRVDETLATWSWTTGAELARAVRDAGENGGEALDALLLRLYDEARTQRKVAPEAPARRADVGGYVPSPSALMERELAKAMAARQNAAFLPMLVSMLDRHDLRAQARLAIVQLPGAFEYLARAMNDPSLRRDVRMHLPRTLCLFDATQAVRALLPHLLVETDGSVRFKILRSLVRLRRANPSLTFDESILQRAAQRLIDQAEELQRWGTALRGPRTDAPTSERSVAVATVDPLQAAHHLLSDLVRDKEKHALQRLFMVLELLYGEDFEDIGRGIKSRVAKTRAGSLELAHNLIPPPLRESVLALVEDAPHGSAGAPLSYEAAIREILASGTITMRTLAEYRAIELGISYQVRGERADAKTLESALGRRTVLDAAREIIQAPASAGPAPIAGGASRAPA